MADDFERDGEIAWKARTRPRAPISPVLRPASGVECWLEPGEQLIARRSAVTVDRRELGSGDRPPSGDLYVTSQRLVLAGGTLVSIWLPEIEEAALVRDRLVLLLNDGVGVTITCDRPELLRALIAAARSACNGAVVDAEGQRAPR
jgi:hypothetical protein